MLKLYIEDYSDVYGGDLNNAFVNEHNDMIDSSYMSDILDDRFQSLSEKSDCELERNNTSCDVVRIIFCGHSPDGAIAEDDEMDSFMRTHIYESDSEESLVYLYISYHICILSFFLSSLLSSTLS